MRSVVQDRERLSGRTSFGMMQQSEHRANMKREMLAEMTSTHLAMSGVTACNKTTSNTLAISYTISD